ncbi:hypothetical protein LCM23_12935 [Cytobacillus kochii]|nr:hypothetical protein [Cytobacillus kochii]MCA1026999.1 hypothetical protein [Cytobacillus kochii]
MLQDLSGWFRRNVRKMNSHQIKKDLNEINRIKRMLEKELELKGVS